MCDCPVCVRAKKIAEQIALCKQAGLDDAAKLLDELHMDVTGAEMDRDVNRAIIDGSWPTADEQILAIRQTSELRLGPYDKTLVQ